MTVALDRGRPRAAGGAFRALPLPDLNGGLPIRMARRYLNDSSPSWTDYALAGLGFSVVFLLAGYALVGLHRVSARRVEAV